MNFDVHNTVVTSAVETAGDTATPTVLRLALSQRDVGGGNRKYVSPILRVRALDAGTLTNATNATIAVTSGYGSVLVTNTSNKDLTIRHQPDVAATGTLTVDTQPTAGDTMTIGSTVYTFTADGTADAAGEIDVGADLADAKTLIVAAINGTDGINTAHPTVSASAFSTHDCTLTAKTAGADGNSIATTETFTAGTNVFGAATLTGGIDELTKQIRVTVTNATAETVDILVCPDTTAGGKLFEPTRISVTHASA